MVIAFPLWLQCNSFSSWSTLMVCLFPSRTSNGGRISIPPQELWSIHIEILIGLLHSFGSVWILSSSCLSTGGWCDILTILQLQVGPPAYPSSWLICNMVDLIGVACWFVWNRADAFPNYYAGSMNKVNVSNDGVLKTHAVVEWWILTHGIIHHSTGSYSTLLKIN